MKKSWLVHSLFLLIVATALPGCMAGSSTVPLTYPADLGAHPWCRWSVTVVGFVDRRADTKTLGVKDADEGRNYVAGSDVADWMTRAFYDELKNRGCDCVYKQSALEADTDFVITGEVLKASLDKVGFTDFNSSLSLFVELQRKGERVYAETYNGELDKSFALGSDAPGEVLAEALQFVVSGAVEKLITHMKEADR